MIIYIYFRAPFWGPVDCDRKGVEKWTQRGSTQFQVRFGLWVFIVFRFQFFDFLVNWDMGVFHFGVKCGKFEVGY